MVKAKLFASAIWLVLEWAAFQGGGEKMADGSWPKPKQSKILGALEIQVQHFS